MQNFLNFLVDLLLYFWSAFININYWPVSFPFYLSLAGVVVMFFMWLFFGERKAVL